MAQYKAIDPNVEIHGQTILAVVDDALARFSEEYRQRARSALADNGITDPTPDDWYPQQAWLNTFEVLADELEPHILDRLGEETYNAAEWPTEISGVEEGLKSIDTAYRRNHRDGEIGFYQFRELDERTGKIVCQNPYPCHFDRGLIRAVAREYAPVESFVFIEEPNEQCRRNGADACEYRVSW